jgi:carbon storage regulator
MLILTRKAGQRIQIGDIVVTVKKTSNAFAKIGIEAPDDVRIMRDEISEATASNQSRTAARGIGRSE